MTNRNIKKKENKKIFILTPVFVEVEKEKFSTFFDVDVIDKKTKTRKPAENITKEKYLEVAKKGLKSFYNLEKDEESKKLCEELLKDDNLLLSKWYRASRKIESEGDEKKKEVKIEVFKNPKELADIQQSLFSNAGFRDPDFLGYTDERGFNEAKWKRKDLTALVPTKDLPLLDQRKKKVEGQGYLIPTPPKIAVSQAKNIDTLLVLLEKENRKKDQTGQDREGFLEFALKDYAKIRGKSETELARGGKFIDELKRDLISGGITSYVLDLEATTGRKSYLIQNFYGLEVPKAKSKEKWRVIFNEPYKTFILSGGQYYPILLEAIQDKSTDNEKGYLYFFLKSVLRYTNTSTDFKTQLKVSTLLDKIKIRDAVKERPQEAFKVLAECIYYTATSYKAFKITEVRFFESGKCKKVKVITDLEKFKSWNYQDFIKEVLTPLGLSDIREALISFNTPQEAKPEGTDETGQTGQDRTTL